MVSNGKTRVQEELLTEGTFFVGDDGPLMGELVAYFNTGQTVPSGEWPRANDGDRGRAA